MTKLMLCSSYYFGNDYKFSFGIMSKFINIADEFSKHYCFIECLLQFYVLMLIALRVIIIRF